MSPADKDTINEIFPDPLTAQQREVFERTLEYYDELSDKFAKKDLRFFAMKTFRSCPYVDTDIDLVLVDRSRRREYIEVLKELGFTNIWNISILREPRKRFFVKIADNGQIRMPIVHVHFTVSWNGIDCLDAYDVWRRLRSIKINGKDIRVPSVEDELLITAAHTMHENTYITMGELLHIRNLLSENKNIDIGHMIAVCKRYNWVLAFKNYVSYAEASYFSITKAALFSPGLIEALDISGDSKIRVDSGAPPFVLPGRILVPGYISKTSKDLIALRWGNIPRELLTFGLVIWLFRKKKLTKFRKGQ